MTYPGKVVPQADRLSVVVELIERIAAGNHTDQDIIPPGYDPRQGRYYRAAVEDLGLVVRTAPNHADLTSMGRRLAKATPAERRRILRQLITTQNPFLAELLEAIRRSDVGLNREQIVAFIRDRTVLTGSTPGRRYSSVKAWLTDLGLVEEQNGRLVRTGSEIGFGAAEVDSDVSVLEGAPPEFVPDDVPDVPRDLPSRMVKRMVDIARNERADAAHEHLRARVANNAGLSGYTARPSGYIDLCVANNERIVIFEMKSATKRNYIKQVRSGVAQLYEYRYVQRLPDAELCLVIESAPPAGHEWVVEYLVEDRGVSIIYCDDANALVEPDVQGGSMADFTD